jgi:CHAT domain
MPQPTTAEGRRWISETHEGLAAWAAAEGEERVAALGRSCRALQNLLGEEPSYAADILQLALSPVVLLKAVEPEAALTLGDVGLRASLLLPELRPVDATRSALLELGLAEASLAAGRPVEAEAHLDALDRQLATLDTLGVISQFLQAAADCLRGRIHEEGLELEKAAASYEEALDRVAPMLSRAAQRRKVSTAWTDSVIGPVEADQREDTDAMGVQETLAAVFVWALLGCARVDRGASGDAELKKVLRRSWKAVTQYGLPEGLRVPQLAAVVGRMADLLGTEKALAFVESITDEHLERAHLSPEADRPVLLAAIAHSAASEGNDVATSVLYEDALRAAQDAGSKPTMARVWARYVEDMVHEPDQEHDLIEGFLRYLTVWGFSTASLPEKAEFEVALTTVLDYALALWSVEPTAANRMRLGILLDLLRRPQWVPLPARWDLDRDRQDVRSLAGLWFAMDWLGRLRVALRRHPDTAAIVVRSLRDRTVFLYASQGEDEIRHATAWTESQEATNELATAARAEFDFLLMSGATTDGDFEELCRAAFRELPDAVREVIRSHEFLLVVPDARTDSESAPFELLHDGDAYLGTSKVIARAPSLREAVRALEGGAAGPSRKRGLVAAAAVVEGFPPLLYALGEADHLRRKLETEGWDVAAFKDDRLTPRNLLDRLQHVSVSHLAAHGISTAGDEALLLPAGERLTVEFLVRRAPARLPFLYLSSCFLGMSRYLGGGARRGLAHAFTELGAPAVVSSLNPVEDRVATMLSAAFYEEALAHPVGEALRRARARLAERGVAAPLWGTTVLFGDPHLRLFDTHERPRAEPDSAVRLLDAFANPGPEHWRLERYPGEAIVALRDEPHDPRLRGAVMLIESLAQAEKADDPRAELHFAVELADQLGHAPSSALVRLREADHLAGRNRPGEALTVLEGALPILDSLHEIDTRWGELRLQVYGFWKRLDNQQRGEDEIALESDGSEEELAAELNEILGSQAIAERAGQDIAFRVPGRSLADIAWNAVRVGHPWRFRSLRARAEVGTQLAAKLELAEFLPAGNPWAPTILTGILDYLWKGLAPLDAETVHRSTGTLLAAIEDLGTHWTSAEGEPWLDAVLDFRSEVRGSVWVAEVLPPEHLEHLLRQSRESLGDAWRELAAGLARDYPDALAGCSAFVTGAIIETHVDAPDEDPLRSEVLAYLKALLTRVEGAIEHAGNLRAYEPEREAPDELERWRHEEGLTSNFATRVRTAG